MGIGTPDCLMLTVCAEEGVYRRSPSEQADCRDRGRRGVTRRWHRQLHPSTTRLDGALGAESSEAYFMVASLGSRTVRPSALAVSSAVLGAASSWPGRPAMERRKQPDFSGEPTALHRPTPFKPRTPPAVLTDATKAGVRG